MSRAFSCMHVRPIHAQPTSTRFPSTSVRAILLAVLFAGPGTFGASPDHGAQPQVRAQEAFAKWIQEHRKLDPGLKAEDVLATGTKLAKARAAEMRELMKDNPAAFVRLAMPSRERALLPPQLQSFVERRVKGQGSFKVYCGGLPLNDAYASPAAVGYLREVHLGGSSFHAFVFGKWRDQTSFSDGPIEGIALADGILLGDTPLPSDKGKDSSPIGKSSPNRTGTNTLLYMIARFADESSDPIDDPTALSQMAPVATFWLNNSSGTVSLSGLVNPAQVMDIVHIILPHPHSYGPTYNNNFGQLLADARNAALAQGYNYTNYNLDAVVTSNRGFTYAGRAYVGDQGCHLVSPNTTLRTAGHAASGTTWD